MIVANGGGGRGGREFSPLREGIGGPFAFQPGNPKSLETPNQIGDML